MSLDLQKALAEWQEALRLQDWDIKAEMLPPAEYEYKINLKNTAGFVDIDRVHKRASITLLDADGADSLEYQLVHELTHVLIDNFDAVAEHAISMAPGKTCIEVLGDCRKYESEIAVHKNRGGRAGEG